LAAMFAMSSTMVSGADKEHYQSWFLSF
jgi:hypothetical protein